MSILRFGVLKLPSGETAITSSKPGFASVCANKTKNRDDASTRKLHACPNVSALPSTDETSKRKLEFFLWDGDRQRKEGGGG